MYRNWDYALATDRTNVPNQIPPFINICYKEKLIPQGFQIDLQPSMGNHDGNFLQQWYKKINDFSLDLLQHTMKFCETTISDMNPKSRHLNNR